RKRKSERSDRVKDGGRGREREGKEVALAKQPPLQAVAAADNLQPAVVAADNPQPAVVADADNLHPAVVADADNPQPAVMAAENPQPEVVPPI
ncbi:protein spt2-like protein, partial [Lasius niger]